MSLDPRRHAFRPDLADAALAGKVDAARFVEPSLRRVASPTAALRRRPQADAPLDTEAVCGDGVRVLESTADGWSWVQLASDSYVGYMRSEALGDAGAPPTHRVVVPRTFVYPAADVKAPPVGWLPMGASVAASLHDPRFMRAGPGFVIARHLAPVATNAPDFVAVAETLLGVPYLWGGRTPNGIDCSGLVQLAMRMAGRAVPRDSDMQERELGTPLASQGELRRGDLVFWKGHVGIMRDGTTLLHANGFHMLVASEPLAEAASRTEAATGSLVTSIRRP